MRKTTSHHKTPIAPEMLSSGVVESFAAALTGARIGALPKLMGGNGDFQVQLLVDGKKFSMLRFGVGQIRQIQTWLQDECAKAHLNATDFQASDSGFSFHVETRNATKDFIVQRTHHIRRVQALSQEIGNALAAASDAVAREDIFWRYADPLVAQHRPMAELTQILRKDNNAIAKQLAEIMAYEELCKSIGESKEADTIRAMVEGLVPKGHPMTIEMVGSEFVTQPSSHHR